MILGLLELFRIWVIRDMQHFEIQQSQTSAFMAETLLKNSVQEKELLKLKMK